MATFSDIGLSQPAASTITMKLRSVTLDQNSTVVHQEILSIGDTDSTANVARVITGTPSTHAGLVVRGVLYQSTAADLLVTAEQSGVYAVTQGSTAATEYFPVRIVNSSGNEWAHLGNDYTDGSTVSTLAGAALAFNNSSNNTMRLVGSTTPLPAYLADSTGRAVAFSTASPAAGAVALTVREGLGTINSTSVLVRIDDVAGSTVLISSVAGTQHKVFAFSAMSTHVGLSSASFNSSVAIERWGMLMGSGSSGVSGANLAVSPPAWLFRTDAANALTFTATSTGLYRISVSWFSE